VVERAVLKWSHVIKPPGKLSHCHMSNISASGDVAVAVATYKEGANEYGELTLFNSDGKIALSKRYDKMISNPQLSDDGNTIAVQVGIDTLTAYDKRGELLWSYSVEKERGIRDYKLSHDGRYAVIVVPDLVSLKGHFILLRDGAVEWVKPSRGVAMEIAISPNNEYIASASSYKGKTHVTLYTTDGTELWNTVVKGDPFHVDVSDNGEVLLVNDLSSGVVRNPLLSGRGKIFFIAGGRVLWDRAGYGFAQFTRSGDRIVAIRARWERNDLSIDVFDRKGELLWKIHDVYHFAISDDYYVLWGNKGFVLVSAEGEEMQSIWVGGLKENIVNVKISPNGRYFTVEVKDSREGICRFYFYENRDILIKIVKERLLKEIDELIKR